MNEEVIKERLNGVDKELEKHEKRIGSLEKTYSIMERMEFQIKEMDANIAKLSEKIDNQSNEKGRKWDKLIDYLFYFIIAALLGYVIHKMGLK
jgi:septal ring factor EnvC (AmiA/AmiB activator)